MPMIPPCLFSDRSQRTDRPWIGRTLILTGLLLMAGAVEAAPERIGVEPATIEPAGGRSRQQVAVTGYYADGSVRDLTDEARFKVVPPGLASASPTGVVTPGAEGRGRLVIEAGGHATEASVRVVRAGWARPVSYRQDVVAL